MATCRGWLHSRCRNEATLRDAALLPAAGSANEASLRELALLPFAGSIQEHNIHVNVHIPCVVMHAS